MLKIINNVTMGTVKENEIKEGMVLRIQGYENEVNKLIWNIKHKEVAEGFTDSNGIKTLYIEVLPMEKATIKGEFAVKYEEQKDLIYRVTVTTKDEETAEILINKMADIIENEIEYEEISICNDFEYYDNNIILEMFAGFEYGMMGDYRKEMARVYKMAKKMVLSGR